MTKEPGTAELYACMLAREFPAQTLLRLRPELRNKPVAVLEGEPPLQQVGSLNAEAVALGACHGMTRAEMETLPAVVLLARSQQEESAARAALLECAGRFSPRVEEHSAETEFLCVADIAGTEKLFGTPEKLGRRLQREARSRGFNVSVAISRNFHAARCMAMGAEIDRPVVVIPPGQEREALAQLPLSVLDISSAQLETLALWGIATLGQLAALPEKELISRMGQEGNRLRRLARGELPHCFVPVEPVLALEERIELDTPVELLDSLLFVVGTMLDQLLVRAAAHCLVLASVTVTLQLERGASHIRTVQPALPAKDRSLWLKLLHLDLQSHPPAAAILAVQLKAEPGSTRQIQFGLFSPQLPEPSRLDVTLARIRAIVGEGCVGRAVLLDSYRPNAFTVTPFALPPAAPEKPEPRQTFCARRRLREAAGVTLRGDRPASVIFRDKRYAVERAYGPWNLSGDWWSPAPWSQEQWDVLARADDGALLCGCLMRDGSGWQMETLYD